MTTVSFDDAVLNDSSGMILSPHYFKTRSDHNG